MRKILLIQRDGIAALSVLVRYTRLATQAAGLAIALCCSCLATAQSPQSSQAVGYGLMAYGPTPVSGGGRTAGDATVDAAYSVLTDTTNVQPAAHRGGLTRMGSLGRRSQAPQDPCNAGCDVSWYGNYEALWLRRENDDRFSMSRNAFLPDFEYELGGRYTVGRLLDCVNGWEAVYAGPFDWQRSSSIAGAGNLQSQLFASNGYTAADINSFNNANVHTQGYRAQLHSVEINRRWWTWDVLSTMIGIRYIDYEEDYLFLSNSAANGNGLFLESVDNQMVGAQIGGDLMYPVSLRSNVGVRGKAGVYANFDERSTFLSNNGNILLNAGDNDVDVAGLIELGVFANYQIVPSVRLIAGYEFWYMPGMATVPEQQPSRITPASGTTVFDSADLFLHGGSAGVQILF